MQSPNEFVDQLVFAAREAADLHDWASDYIAETDHSDCLCESMAQLRRATRPFTQYSDGRPVTVYADIEPGHYFRYNLRAEYAEAGERLHSTGQLLTDPGTPSRGSYRVYVDDAAATIRVEYLTPLRAI